MPRVVTIEIPDGFRPIEPTPALVHGLEINRALHGKDGNALVLAVAQFLATEKIEVSDAALIGLISVVRKGHNTPQDS